MSIGGGVPYEIVPQYKLDGHITYHLPIDKTYGDVSFSADYSWVEQSFSTVLQNEVFQDILPGHDDLDMSLNWQDVWGKPGLSARLWVTNVMENKWVNGCLCAWHVVGEYGFQPAQPRMFGATVRYEFGPESAPQAATPAYVPPAPQPVQPAAPKSYLVFFDFDKSPDLGRTPDRRSGSNERSGGESHPDRGDWPYRYGGIGRVQHALVQTPCDVGGGGTRGAWHL
jgi:hypothetical protein